MRRGFRNLQYSAKIVKLNLHYVTHFYWIITFVIRKKSFKKMREKLLQRVNTNPTAP